MKYFILFLVLNTIGANSIASNVSGQEFYDPDFLDDEMFMKWYVSNSIAEYDPMSEIFNGEDLSDFKEDIQIIPGVYSSADKDFFVIGDQKSGTVSGYVYRTRTQHPVDGEPATQTQMYRYLTWQIKNNLMNRSNVTYNPDTIIWFKVMLARLSRWGFDPSASYIVDVTGNVSGEGFRDCKENAQDLRRDLPAGAGVHSNLLFDMAMLGHPEVATYLMDVVGIDPNVVNCQNVTAVHIALQYRHTAYAKAIIEHPSFNNELLNRVILIKDRKMDAEYYPTPAHQKFGLGDRSQKTAYDFWKYMKIDFESTEGHIGSQSKLQGYLLKNGARSGYEHYSAGLCMMVNPSITFDSQPWIQASMDDGTFDLDKVIQAEKDAGVDDFTSYKSSARTEACYGWYVQVDHRCRKFGIDCHLKQEIMDYSPELGWKEGLFHYNNKRSRYPNAIIDKYYWLLRTPVK
jgi:hypothetical protein